MAVSESQKKANKSYREKNPKKINIYHTVQQPVVLLIIMLL